MNISIGENNKIKFNEKKKSNNFFINTSYYRGYKIILYLILF